MFWMESSKLREVNYCSLLFVDRKCSVQNLAKHRLHVWVVSPWTAWPTAVLHSVTCLLHAAHSQSHCSLLQPAVAGWHKDATLATDDHPWDKAWILLWQIRSDLRCPESNCFQHPGMSLPVKMVTGCCYVLDAGTSVMWILGWDAAMSWM